MKAKGINIEKLKSKISANGHSLSRNSIGNIINERNSPKIETLQLIADALEVELWELFSSPSSEEQENLNGFVEYQNHVHKIKSNTDLKQLYEMVFGKDSEKSNQKTQGKVQIPGDYLVRRIKTRNSVKSARKLRSHVYKRYNVTVCNKKDLEAPNDIQRDNKIWVFRSRNEEQKAQSFLKEVLKFDFNA
jgi:transcriptional regulator with XRE-family HTH domain